MEMTRVLVTRPETAASKTAAKLAEKGYSVTVLPLTRIVSLPVAGGCPGGRFDGVAATSANAIRHAPEDLLTVLRDLPAFAVGERTAESFRKRGFARIHASGQDARKLAEMITAHPRGRRMRLAYLCGRVRMPAFEKEIGKNGAEITAIETYDAQTLSYSADSLANRLAGEPFDAVLLYSARSAEAFGKLLDGGWVDSALFAGTHLICLSPKIADALPGEWEKNAVCCALPEEKALFDLLANL